MTDRLQEDALREGWLRLYPASDIAQGRVLPPEPLFKDFLLSKTLTVLSSESGTGKTWFLLDMLLSLDLGVPFLGKFAPQPGHHRCLYIGMDSSAWDVSKQFMKLCRGRDIKPHVLKALNSDLLLRGDKRFIVTDPARLRWVADWVAETSTDVVMLDTWRAVNVGDENNSLQAEAAMEALRSLRDQLSIAIIFAHHTRKQQMGMDDTGNDAVRGSNAVVGAVDFHIRLQKLRNRILLTMPKGREDFEGWEDLTIARELQDTPAGPAVRLVIEEPEDTYAPLLDSMNRGLTKRIQLVDEAFLLPGMTRDKAEKFVDNGLRRLKQAGKVRPTGRGIWELVKEP